MKQAGVRENVYVIRRFLYVLIEKQCVTLHPEMKEAVTKERSALLEIEIEITGKIPSTILRKRMITDAVFIRENSIF